MTRSLRLRRRTVLRGLLGSAVALPVLECMLDGNGRLLSQLSPGAARAQGAAFPQRYCVVFAGQAIGGDDTPRNTQRINNVVIQEDGHFIVPDQSGAGYTLTTPLQPLANLRPDFSLVSGLAIPFSRTSTDGTAVPVGGAFRDFHGGGCSPLLSATRSTEARFTANGITSDQVVANLTQNRGTTTLPSLVLRAQPEWYLSGSDFAGRQFVSYRGGGDPIAAQTSPRIAFQSLFQGFVPAGDDEAARADFEKRKRQSVLDLVLSKRDRLTARLGAADKQRLERHFDEIRGLEERVRAIPPVQTGSCVVPGDPGADPAVGGNNQGTGADTIGTNTGYSDEDTRARVMADLIHMAFVCDLTRAASLQITSFQSHMNVYPLMQPLTTVFDDGIRADLHEVGHNGDPRNKGQLAVSLLLQWHIKHYAYLLQKLKDTPEGDGNALDNSVVVFMPEAGHGVQLNTANPADTFATHSVEDMILLVGGNRRALRLGEHIPGQGAHPGQVLLAAMRAAGNSSDTFGEVNGAFAPLLLG